MSKTQETFARVGGALKTEHGNVGWIKVKAGAAFFRRPTEREYLGWATHSDKDLKAQALAVICEACFLGVLADDASELEAGAKTFAAICVDEGPAFLDSVGSSAGDLMIRLAGVRRRDFGFL